jgi:hypothetical protein
MKLKKLIKSHAFLYMLQQRCDRSWFDAKAFGINAPKSIKDIFFPIAQARQQKAWYYCVPQNTSPLLCPLKISLN